MTKQAEPKARTTPSEFAEAVMNKFINENNRSVLDMLLYAIRREREEADQRVRELEGTIDELIVFLERMLGLIPPNGKHWERRMHAEEALGRAKAIRARSNQATTPNPDRQPPGTAIAAAK